MAAQRVQNYLERHKIGPLFESLMARLIQDTPDDPIDYIIKVLRGMQKKQRLATDLGDRISSPPRTSSRKSILRSSQNELNATRQRSNNLAASWSAGEVQTDSKSRDYPKPWTSNSKSIENKTWSPERLGRGDQPRAAWNNDTRVPSHDFDEWFRMENGETEVPQKSQREKYRFNGVKSWESSNKTSHDKTLPSRGSHLASDELETELNLGHHKKSRRVPRSDHEAVTAPVKSRPVKARHAVEEHRQHLQALLLEDSKTKSSRPNGLRHSPEEGMDILERMEDLQEEGVETVARRGAKLNKARPGGRGENVSVTICARCARIIGEQAEMDTSSQVGSAVNDFDSSPLAVRRNRVSDDLLESFDSASEVNEKLSSRRNQMWPVTSDTESDLTPRNSKVMFQPRAKSPSLKETRHSNSRRKIASPEPSSRPSSSRSYSSVPDGFLNSQRKSWAANSYSSDNETEADTARPSTPGSINGRPWDIPSDNYSEDETRSSRLGNVGPPLMEDFEFRKLSRMKDGIICIMCSRPFLPPKFCPEDRPFQSRSVPTALQTFRLG